MDIKEIIFKPSPQHISVEEMAFVVQEYIKEKTDKSVLINIYKDVAEGLPNIVKDTILRKELALLNSAYDTAIQYYSIKFR